MLRKTLTILSLIGLLLSLGVWAVSWWESMRHFISLEADWLPFYYRDFQLGSWNLGIPLWIPLLFFAAAFSWSSIPIYRRRKRKKLGLCLKCGYDLRASKDRCPECGQEFDSELITTADGDCGGC